MIFSSTRGFHVEFSNLEALGILWEKKCEKWGCCENPGLEGRDFEFGCQKFYGAWIEP